MAVRLAHCFSMTALDPSDFDDLLEFIRVQVAAGYAPAPDMVDEAVDVFADTTLDPQALREAAVALANRALAEHAVAQEAWPQVTDCDRLDQAFAEAGDAAHYRTSKRALWVRHPVRGKGRPAFSQAGRPGGGLE